LELQDSLVLLDKEFKGIPVVKDTQDLKDTQDFRDIQDYKVILE
jgi:hypothetical protein